MAVEARNLYLSANREIMNPIEANINFYNAQAGYSSVPLSGTTTAETLLPPYSSFVADQKTAVKSDSGLTYNVSFPVQRKRSRDSISPFISFPAVESPHKNCASFSFLGEDISLHIQQQQLDIDCLICQHMDKVKMELEEKRKRQARRIMEAIELGMMKRLKAKEAEIEKIGKLNWALEERVKSLCIENQIWRNLAQTNEATANALRTNLEQVLMAQVKDDRTCGGAGLEDDDLATVAPPGAAALMEDAQSCCGSTDENDGDGGRRNSAGGGWSAQDKDEGGDRGNKRMRSNRLCRQCGKEESCVLILPCRHLCLCTVCGSTLHTCPICKSFKNASVHVNMS